MVKQVHHIALKKSELQTSSCVHHRNRFSNCNTDLLAMVWCNDSVYTKVLVYVVARKVVILEQKKWSLCCVRGCAHFQYCRIILLKLFKMCHSIWFGIHNEMIKRAHRRHTCFEAILGPSWVKGGKSEQVAKLQKNIAHSMRWMFLVSSVLFLPVLILCHAKCSFWWFPVFITYSTLHKTIICEIIVVLIL